MKVKKPAHEDCFFSDRKLNMSDYIVLRYIAQFSKRQSISLLEMCLQRVVKVSQHTITCNLGLIVSFEQWSKFQFQAGLRNHD